MKKVVLFALLITLLISGCKKTDTTPDPNPNGYFMSANIDSTAWKVSKIGQAYFGAHYDHYNDKFFINIGSDDQSPNSICRGIFISFGFVPKVGRHNFNNTGPSQIYSGVSATYVYNRVNHISYKYSTGGYVEIESISKDNIKGNFNFTAKGDSSDSTTTSITSGSFFVLNVGGGDRVWPGPY